MKWSRVREAKESIFDISGKRTVAEEGLRLTAYVHVAYKSELALKSGRKPQFPPTFCYRRWPTRTRSSLRLGWHFAQRSLTKGFEICCGSRTLTY